MGKNQGAPSKTNVGNVLIESAQPNSNADDSRPSLHTKNLRAKTIREIASKVVSISSGIPQRPAPAGKISQKVNGPTSELDKLEKGSVKVIEELKKDEPLLQNLSALCLTLSEDLKAAAALPKQEQYNALRNVQRVVEEFTAHADGLVAPPLPEPDPTGGSYELYKPGTDPYKHLKDVWKPWLKHFSPELLRDYLYQDQLRRRDERLFNALYARRRGINRDHKVLFKELLKPRSARIDAELREQPEEKIKKMASLAVSAYSR